MGLAHELPKAGRSAGHTRMIRRAGCIKLGQALQGSERHIIEHLNFRLALPVRLLLRRSSGRTAGGCRKLLSRRSKEISCERFAG